MTETQAAAARAAAAAAGEAGNADGEPPTAAHGSGPGGASGAASGGPPGSGGRLNLSKPEDEPGGPGGGPARPNAPVRGSARPPSAGGPGSPGGPGGPGGPPGPGPTAPPVAGPVFFPPPPAGAAGSVGPTSGPPGPTSGPPRPVSGPSAGRASVVGRAAVGDATGSAPAYTRAPGMAPPPDVLVPSQGGDTQGTQALPVGIAAARAAAAPSVARGAASVSAPPGAPGGVVGDRETTGPITGASRVTEAVRAARATVASAAGRTSGGTRRARLHIKRIDPWSMMKFSFAVSLVLFFVAVVATSVLYLALDAMGVFDEVNKALAELIGSTGGSGNGFKITAKGVVGGSALLGAVNVVLFTALATLGAFIYNVCADLVGGIELTLAEKD